MSIRSITLGPIDETSAYTITEVFSRTLNRCFIDPKSVQAVDMVCARATLSRCWMLMGRLEATAPERKSRGASRSIFSRGALEFTAGVWRLVF